MTPTTTPLTLTQLAYSLDQLEGILRTSKSTLASEITHGHIVPSYVGRRVIITATELRRWLGVDAVELTVEPLGYTPTEFAAAISVSRSQVHKEITAGRLHQAPVGNRRLITAAEAQRYLDDLPNERQIAA